MHIQWFWIFDNGEKCLYRIFVKHLSDRRMPLTSSYELEFKDWNLHKQASKHDNTKYDMLTDARNLCLSSVSFQSIDYQLPYIYASK